MFINFTLNYVAIMKAISIEIIFIIQNFEVLRKKEKKGT